MENQALDGLMARMPSQEEIARIDAEAGRKEAEKEASKQKALAETKAAYMQKQLDRIPSRFKNSTFDNYDLEADERVKAKQEFLINHLRSGRSVVMYGNNGTGKTHLAFSAIKEQIALGKSCAYILAPELFDEIRSSFGDNRIKGIIERYASYDYLVVDEVDKTYGSPTEFINLYRIINRRYEDMKPTVLITNGKKENIIEIIGRSSYERVVEDGTAVEMDWESHRRKKVGR